MLTFEGYALCHNKHNTTNLPVAKDHFLYKLMVFAVADTVIVMSGSW